MNFYKHHLGDYDSATAHLTWDEDMAYRRLLGVYYRREQPILAEEACRLVRATSKAQKAAVDAVLKEFFDQREDGWHNKRADREIDAYQAQVSHNREVGKLGGRPKETRVVSGNNHSGSIRKPNHNPNQEPEPLTKNQKKKERTARARETPLPLPFEISERVKTWADSKGFPNLEPYREFFCGRMKANGKTYTDWDEAFMNCVREDWPGFRKSDAPVYNFDHIKD